MTQRETHKTTHEVFLQKKENLDLVKSLASTTSSQAMLGLGELAKRHHEVQSAKSKLWGSHRTNNCFLTVF